MDTFLLLLALLALAVALVAVVLALRAKLQGPAARLKQLELELIELSDLLDSQARSLKKLHGRTATREAREQRHAEREQPSDDPLDRRPGETAEQWKARINRSLSPIRRN